MLERAVVRGMFAEIPQPSAEQIEQLRHSVLRFRHEFDQLDKIRGQRDAWIIEAETIECFKQFDLAQRVQLALPAAAELNVAFEKQIEPSGKAALGLARAFGDRLQFPMLLSQPRDDEARLGELDLAEKDGSGGIQDPV